MVVAELEEGEEDELGLGLESFWLLVKDLGLGMVVDFSLDFPLISGEKISIITIEIVFVVCLFYRKMYFKRSYHAVLLCK